MKLYNTLTRQKQSLQPRKPGHISLYSCGPTVYHYYHVGNLRNAVFNDTLKRALLLNDYHVDHIMNITDVGHLTGDADEGSDKLQDRAKEEGKTVWEVADFYTKAFMKDMLQLNVLPPQQYIKATDTIADQIKMVQTLLDKSFAYQVKQAIYFDVTKLDDYGKLTGQRLDQKEVGARSDVVTDPDKHHPQDFALWFFTVGHFADHTMHWPSPWGEGFPGWHLECSAIIEHALGETIDIHTGGVDHIGTHHTNEIAQSEAAHDGRPLANMWLHNEFLLVNGQKMSKSLQNTFRLDDVVERGFDPMALRLLYLQSHYRTQQNFSWEILEAAGNLLARLEAWADGQFQDGAGPISDDAFNAVYDKCLAALSDDLNTPEVLSALSGLLDAYEQRNVTPTAEQIEKVERMLGLRLTKRTDISQEQKAVLVERAGARQAKDFAAADAARKALATQGIEVEDTPAGSRWRRVRIKT